jgi:hypothetical protein
MSDTVHLHLALRLYSCWLPQGAGLLALAASAARSWINQRISNLAIKIAQEMQFKTDFYKCTFRKRKHSGTEFDIIFLNT